jgi:hypothetical protein
MISQVAPLAKPKARGYFGIDAKVYGHMGHVDPSALKVLRRPCLPSCLLSATLSLLGGSNALAEREVGEQSGGSVLEAGARDS